MRIPSDHLLRPDRVVATADGATAAFVVTTRAGDPAATGVWCGPVVGEPARICGDVPVGPLAFSPDGTRLAYALPGGDGASVVVVRVVAGDTETRREITGYAEAIAWPDPDRLLVLVAGPGADSASLSSGKPLGTGPATEVIVRSTGTRAGFRRVWHLPPGGGAPVPITPPDVTVWEFAALDGGRIVAVCGGEPSEAGWYRPTLAILGPGPGDRSDLHVSPWQLSCPAVSPDRTRLAWLEGWTSDRGLHTGDIRIRDLAGGATTTVTPGIDPTWIGWSEDGDLWLAGWSGLRTAWGRIDAPAPPGPETVPPVRRDRIVHLAAECVTSRWHPQIVPLPGGRALTVHSGPSTPPEVAILHPDAPPRPWSRLNRTGPADRGLTVRELRWDAAGTEIEGLLVTPSAGDGPWPLVVDIHGGPTLAYHHSWDLGWAETLIPAGYAILLPNPVGGAGRGQDFGRANLGDPAGAEYAQVVAGIAHCAALGYADPDRVAAIGASYGGYLTAWAIALGDAVRAGVVIAGISDLASCRGTANNAPFYDVLCQGRPDENPSLYVDRSPVFRLGGHSRPALILHGELDQCVPVSQAYELHAGLRDAGIAAELAVYPGEGHQVQALAHLEDQRSRILAFLAAHLT